jgi:Uma2 family endonuclease
MNAGGAGIMPRIVLEDAAVSDGVPAFIPTGPMTEEEFVDWCREDVRAEWVDGKVILMSPASSRHELLLVWFSTLLQLYADNFQAGRVYGPELQLRFTKRRRSRRAPDIKFVAAEHLDRVQKNHIEGPADLVIEIVSRDSVARDWREKFAEYARAGVPEYWIVDPLSEQMEAYRLGASGRFRRIRVQDGRVNSTVLPGFWIKPEWLWQDPLPNVLGVAREWGIIA